MKNYLFASLLGLATLGTSQLAIAQNYGDCYPVSRNGSQVVYQLNGYFKNTSASFGTDNGGHNFAQRIVNCNGEQATITGLRINPGNPGVAYVTVSSYNRYYLQGCQIDVSQNWQITNYFCN
jgi:hypothetical protein